MLYLFYFGYLLYEGLLISSTKTFDSELRKHLLAHWLNLMIWLPNGQGAKGLGEQVYASESHFRISSLLSVCHH